MNDVREPVGNEDDPGPAVQRILLGEELRRLRTESAMTSEEAAARVKWYRSKMSKIEAGSLLVNTRDISALLKLYGANPDTATRLRWLARQARRKLNPGKMPDWAKQYATLEVSAAGIDYHSGDVIPDSLQTEAYTRALLVNSVVIPAADIRQTARDRSRRAARFHGGNPPDVRVLLGEEAIRRVVGGPEIMLDQLRVLRELSGLPTFSLRIVPSSIGAYAALGTSFVILRLPFSGAFKIYVENLTGADYHSRESHVQAYRTAFERTAAVALDEDASLALIDRHISALTPDHPGASDSPPRGERRSGGTAGG